MPQSRVLVCSPQTGIPTHRPIRRVVERVLAFRVDPPVKTSNAFVGYYLDCYRSCMDMLCAESARFYRRLLSDGRSTISEQNNDTWVAFLTPRNEQRADHLRLFDAYTYNLGRSGGHISVVTTKSSAQRLITLCGARLQFSGRRVKITKLQGTFLQERGGNRGYYFLVP